MYCLSDCTSISSFPSPPSRNQIGFSSSSTPELRYEDESLASLLEVSSPTSLRISPSLRARLTYFRREGYASLSLARQYFVFLFETCGITAVFQSLLPSPFLRQIPSPLFLSRAANSDEPFLGLPFSFSPHAEFPLFPLLGSWGTDFNPFYASGSPEPFAFLFPPPPIIASDFLPVSPVRWEISFLFFFYFVGS